MRLFETDERVGQLEALVGADSAHATAEVLVELAWYLRQSNPQRCRHLIELALALPLSENLLARIELIRNEMQWLAGDAEGACKALPKTLARFAAIGDVTGCADTNLLHAFAATSAGFGGERIQLLARAASYAMEAKDTDRSLFIQAFQVQAEAFSDAKNCAAKWLPYFQPRMAQTHPSTAARIAALRAEIAYGLGDVGESIHWFLRALEGMQANGQRVMAIFCLGNIAAAFHALNDQDASLDWAQRALELAQVDSWPLTLGAALQRVAENLRKTKRNDAAQSLLDHAEILYRPFQGSRGFAILLAELGETAMALGNHELALRRFRELANLSEDVDRRAIQGLRSTVAEGLAKVLIQLGRRDEAEKEAKLGLKLERAKGKSVHEINLLQLLAKLRIAYQQPLEALELLNQALAVAQSIAGYAIPPELFSALAEAHAAIGEFEAAYLASVKATSAREALHQREAENRATALQVRFSIEQSKSEAEQEKQRALLLQQTNVTLDQLAMIGQELTSQLDKQRAFETINRHVHGLLDVQSFTIFLMDADGLSISSVYDVEAGERLPPVQINLDDPDSWAARSLRERSVLLADLSGQTETANYIPDTLKTLSALFSPLIVGERVLGVITVQSTRAHAYGDQEQLIFRTLSAYAAIALDNSIAYTHLREAQEQLVAKEKFSALGAMVVGVAHELNTPIGNCVLVASSLNEQASSVAQSVAQGTLKRTDLDKFIAYSAEASQLLSRSLAKAASLVHTFKQVAEDRASEQRRQFNLKQTTLEVLATLAHTIDSAGHRIEVDIPHDIALEGYPGPFGEVLEHLINNALIHAFAERSDGSIGVSARLLRNRQLELVVSDDGHGISAENLKRIFDPFFTTRLGQGGGGLGLSISYNIATALFGGALSAESRLGHGAQFIWRLPLVAPLIRVKE